MRRLTFCFVILGLSPEEFYEMKVQDILDIIHTVRGHITKARQHQVKHKSVGKWGQLSETFDIFRT